jgi:hypothetical protein
MPAIVRTANPKLKVAFGEINSRMNARFMWASRKQSFLNKASAFDKPRRIVGGVVRL